MKCLWMPWWSHLDFTETNGHGDNARMIEKGQKTFVCFCWLFLEVGSFKKWLMRNKKCSSQSLQLLISRCVANGWYAISREVQNDLWLVTCFAQAASASFGIWNSFVEAQVVSAWYTSEAAEQPELCVVWRLLLPLKVQSVLQAGVTENVSLPFLCLGFCVAHSNTRCPLSMWFKIRSPF